MDVSSVCIRASKVFFIRTLKAFLRLALTCARGSATLHHKLGWAHVRLEEWPAARVAFRKALARDNTRADCHYDLGLACQRLERWDEASAAYRSALARNDTDANWHWRLGEVHARLRDWTSAVAAFQAAIARDDTNAKWHLGLATVQTRLGIWEAAETAYEAAIARDPTDPTWHARLASVRAKLGDWPGAVAAYEAAIARDQTNTELRQRLSRALSRAQDWRNASASLKEILIAEPENDQVRYRLAFCLSRSGNDTEALQHLQPNIDRNNAVLGAFLSGARKNGFAGVHPNAKVLFVSGSHTILARKVSIASRAGGERTYFEHARTGRRQYQRIVEFYEGLAAVTSQTFPQFVPRLHFHSFEESYGYFLYDYVENALAGGPGMVQAKALKNPRFGRRIVDVLIELAHTGIAVKRPWPDTRSERLIALRDIRPYIESQISLNTDDTEFVSGLEKLYKAWNDHYSRYEALPKAITHGNLHDQNMAVSSGGDIAIFDWERFGFAPVGFDLVTLFRDTLEHERFAELADYYFDNLSVDLASEERSYIICMLVVLKSAWRKKPLQKRWLECLNTRASP